MARIPSCFISCFWVTFMISKCAGIIYRNGYRVSAYLEEMGTDKRLTGRVENTIMEVFTMTATSCAMRCFASEKCQSINYKASNAIETNCQLLDISKSSKNATFEDDAGWVHYEPINSDSSLRDACSFASCKDGFRCQNSNNQPKGYECIEDKCRNYCLNGGACFKRKETAYCSCPLGASGTRCENVFKTCKELLNAGFSRNTVYPIRGESGTTFKVFCDMTKFGRILAARFSNADTTNWANSSAEFWYDKIEFGATTTPMINADMINRAFHDVKGSTFTLTRSDDPKHTTLFLSRVSLNGSFRAKMTSYGDFRMGNAWNFNDCKHSGNVFYWEGVNNVTGFGKHECSGDLRARNSIHFWCQYVHSTTTYDRAALMIGGGGSGCNGVDHGIGIAVKDSAAGQKQKDFGDDAETSFVQNNYALNLWIIT